MRTRQTETHLSGAFFGAAQSSLLWEKTSEGNEKLRWMCRFVLIDGWLCRESPSSHSRRYSREGGKKGGMGEMTDGSNSFLTDKYVWKGRQKPITFRANFVRCLLYYLFVSHCHSSPGVPKSGVGNSNRCIRRSTSTRTSIVPANNDTGENRSLHHGAVRVRSALGICLHY